MTGGVYIKAFAYSAVVGRFSKGPTRCVTWLRLFYEEKAVIARLAAVLWVCLVLVQIRDINSGSFGFVELAKDVVTGERVAIKHIERGPKVKLLGSWLW